MECKIIKNKEYCISCLQRKKSHSLFLNLPFCFKCTVHLYNGDIDLEKSKENDTIVWTIEREQIDKKFQMMKIRECIIKSKYKFDKLLRKLESNADDLETDVRATLRELEYAFFFISK